LANWTRLRRQSHAPRELDGTETIYAAADGTLMHMDPEGSETELGTGGPGGSQPGAVRRLDLGVVTAADVAAGPLTLYTPDSGEQIGPVYLTDITLTDNQGLSVGRAVIVDGAIEKVVALASIDSDTVMSGERLDFPMVPLTDAPLTAGGSITVGTPVQVDWEASTDYLTGDVVVGNGTYWSADPAGTSGMTEPDWAANAGPGGFVVDGGVTWTDSTVAGPPATGAMHVYADVCTPEAP
jgi:hypothetical protein